MAKTMMIRLRVSSLEYERIKNTVSAKGFATVSSYLRSVALEKDLWSEQKLKDIYTSVQELRSLLVKR